MSTILPFLMTDGGRRSRNFSTGTFVSKNKSYKSGFDVERIPIYLKPRTPQDFDVSTGYLGDKNK
jgi:hypothetical protein